MSLMWTSASGMSWNNSSTAVCAHKGLLIEPIGDEMHHGLPKGVAITQSSCDLASSLKV